MNRKPPSEPAMVTMDAKLDQIADMMTDRIFARMDRFLARLERLTRDNAILQTRVSMLEEMLDDFSQVARSHGLDIRMETMSVRDKSTEDADEDPDEGWFEATLDESDDEPNPGRN